MSRFDRAGSRARKGSKVRLGVEKMCHDDLHDTIGDIVRRAQFGENCGPWIDVPAPIRLQWRNLADRIMRSLAAAGIELSTHQPARLKSAVTDSDQHSIEDTS